MAKPTNPSPRVIMRIELIPQAKSGLEKLCERLGMTQVATTSRIVEWFCKESDLVQAAVLGLYPEDLRADVATMVLKRMASEKKK